MVILSSPRIDEPIKSLALFIRTNEAIDGLRFAHDNTVIHCLAVWSLVNSSYEI